MTTHEMHIQGKVIESFERNNNIIIFTLEGKQKLKTFFFCCLLTMQIKSCQACWKNFQMFNFSFSKNATWCMSVSSTYLMRNVQLSTTYVRTYYVLCRDRNITRIEIVDSLQFCLRLIQNSITCFFFWQKVHSKTNNGICVRTGTY